MKDVAGVQDVFCGKQTIVHMKRGSAPLPIDQLEELFTSFEIEWESIERDDSAML